ncbi:mas-related G-protein coupled receptor member H-like [Colius striatus]|uniref:mas-related G-protein coupled receptor member H-like n=1 Tax=Colius striatus TaxID=57412 RepID=UPI002B1E4470|nr:mas-related G-protein coupled receptor member H-like [Colius striatus]
MEETNTTDLSLSNVTSGYEHFQYIYPSDCIRHYWLLIIAGVSICICLCGLMGNMLVLWFLGFQMKKNPFTVYVLNLAVADLLLLLFLPAYFTLDILQQIYCLSPLQYASTYDILSTLFMFSYFASMYLLSAMSLERCLSVLFPIWYRCHRPKHLSGITCGVLWALAALFASLLSFACIFYVSCRETWHGVSTVNILIFSLLPFLSNLALFIKLRCGTRRRHPGKLYVAVLLSVTFLFIFGIPYSLMVSINNYYSNEFCYYVTLLLTSLNSSVNPVIYFLVGGCRQRCFRGSATDALRRVFEEKAPSEDGSRGPGDTAAETSL